MKDEGIDRIRTLVTLYKKKYDLSSMHCYEMELVKPNSFCRECERKHICTTAIIDVR